MSENNGNLSNVGILDEQTKLMVLNNDGSVSPIVHQFDHDGVGNAKYTKRGRAHGTTASQTFSKSTTWMVCKLEATAPTQVCSCLYRLGIQGKYVPVMLPRSRRS
jgi:hypothetical protein